MLLFWDEDVYEANGQPQPAPLLQHLARLERALAQLAACAPDSFPLARLRRLAVVATWKARLAAHATGGEAGGQLVQPAVERLLVLLQLLHQESLGAKGVIEYTHVSKTGGGQQALQGAVGQHFTTIVNQAVLTEGSIINHYTNHHYC
jgi:hypothetical protein